MKRLALLWLVLQSLVWGVPALASEPVAWRTVTQVAWVEEWDPAEGRWVQIEETNGPLRARGEAPVPVAQKIERSDAFTTVTTRTYQAAGFAAPEPRAGSFGANALPVAQYGPFVVLDEARAAMIDSTDGASPAAFDAMLRDYPALEVLEMVEAPGTSNDIANLELGRKIRAAGLATHVPHGGSVRSGAVELFLAGTQRSMADSAYFAVHSWLDNYGREPDDFAPDAPENRLYLDYYVEMGMSEELARAFYAMTNSVPHASARWLKADEMRGWVAAAQATGEASALARAGREAELVPVVTLAAIDATPIPAPVIALSIPPLPPVIRASGPVFARPSISYGDVMQVALLQPRPGHANLDSVL